MSLKNIISKLPIKRFSGSDHLKISKNFLKQLFSNLPERDLLIIQKMIIDSTRGNHWNDLSHNTQNVLIEYIKQNPNDSLSILLHRLPHVKNFVALHKMADIHCAMMKGTLKIGDTAMNGHVITQEIADQCKDVFELYDKGKIKEAAKLVKKYMKDDWLNKPGAKLKPGSTKKPPVGNRKEALKAVWKTDVALKNMHKAGKTGALIQVVITSGKHGYKVLKGEDLNTVDAGYELIKETSGAYVSSAVALQAATTVGIVLLSLTPSGWVVIPGTILAGLVSGVATKKGCDLTWEQVEKTSTFRNTIEKLHEMIPTIKGYKKRKIERVLQLAELYPQINFDNKKYEEFIKLEDTFRKKYRHPWHTCPA